VKKLVWADLQAVRRKLDEIDADAAARALGSAAAIPPVELKLDL
jgi:hypothetical protein